MYLERRLVSGLPYYWVVRHRRPEAGQPKTSKKRESVAYLGRLTGVELDQWIATMKRWRSEVDDEGRPLHYNDKPAKVSR